MEKNVLDRKLAIKMEKDVVDPEKNFRRKGAAGIEGSLFQVKLLILFLLRGAAKKYSFRLATEMSEAGKFDDLIFKYKNDNDEEESILLQAKHKTGKKKLISKDSLLTLSDTDFCLLKYFHSYQRFKNMTEMFGNIKEIVLFTNIDFDSKVKKEFSSPVTRNKDHILNIRGTDECGHYKFSENFYSDLREKLEEYQLNLLAIALITNIIDKHSIDLSSGDLFPHFGSVLLSQVFDHNIELGIIRFQHNFVHGQELDNSKTKIFRTILETELNNNTCSRKFVSILQKKSNEFKKLKSKKAEAKEENKKSELSTLENHFHEHLSKENIIFSLQDLDFYVNTCDIKVKNYPKSEVADTKWPDDTIPDDKVEDFLQHLVFAVAQPTEEELGDIIKTLVKKEISFSDFACEFGSDRLQTAIIDWFKDKTNGDILTFLTPDYVLNFFTEVDQKVNTLIKLGCSEEYSRKIKQYSLKFEYDALNPLQEVLLQNESKILQIPSTGNICTLAKIQQILESNDQKYLMVEQTSLLDLSVESAMTTILANRSAYNWLVLDYFDKSSCSYNQIPTIILEMKNKLYKNKKIIIVSNASVDCNLQILENSLTKVARDDTTEKHLTEECRQMLLQKLVTFQGERVALGDLIPKINSNVLLDSGTFLKVITGEEIVIWSPPPNIDDLETAYIKTQQYISSESLVNLKERFHHCVFAFSDYQNDSTSILNVLSKLLCIKHDDIVCITEYFEVDKSMQSNRVIAFINSDRDEHFRLFKTLCRKNPTKLIFWLEILSKNNIYLLQFYNPQFYQKRRFHNVIMNKSFKSKILDDDLMPQYIFSGEVDSNILINILKIRDKEVDALLSKLQTGNIQFVSSEIAGKMFNIIEKKVDVHWFHVEDNMIMWKRSSGRLDELRPHVEEPTLKSSTFQEDEFISSTGNSLVIIADEPGMGKTTSLIMLGQRFVRKKWVIFMDLKKCLTAIDQLLYGKTIDVLDAVNFLLNVKGIGTTTPLEKVLLIGLLESDMSENLSIRPLLLLVDGFDEIGSEHQKKIISLLCFLKTCSAVTIWITTRSYKMEMLEDAFETFSIRFHELATQEQILFLVRFWNVTLIMSNLQSSENYEERLKLYAETLVKKSKEIFSNISRFMGIPLQLRLLSEVYQKGAIEIIKTNQQIDESIIINLLDLYRQFTKNKYEIYIKEKVLLSTHQRYPEKCLKKALIKDHRALAARHLFTYGNAVGNKYLDESYTRLLIEEIKAVGIIQACDNVGNIHFLHKTFAEFFTADLLCYYLRCKSETSSKYLWATNILCSQIWEESFEVIRKFIDLILLENMPLLNAVFKLDSREMFECIRKGRSVNERDDLGRNCLHLASHGDINFVRNLLSKGCDGLITDKFGRNALHYAVRFSSRFSVGIWRHIVYIDNVRYLLTRYGGPTLINLLSSPLGLNAQVNGSVFLENSHCPEELRQLVNTLDKNERTPLDYAVRAELWSVVCELLLYGANCSQLNQQAIQYLLEYVKSVHFDHQRLLPIISLILINFPQAYIYLTEQKQNENYYNYFCEHGHTKMIELFVKASEQSNDFKSTIKDINPLIKVNESEVLSDGDRLDVLKYLLEIRTERTQLVPSTDDIRQTGELACVREHQETFRYIVDFIIKREWIDSQVQISLLNCFLAVAQENNRSGMIEFLNEIISENFSAPF